MYVNLYPFNPQLSKTGSVALTVGTASANVQLPDLNTGAQPAMCAVRIVNSGTNLIWVNFGATSAVTAAIPTSGNAGAGFAMLPNSERVFWLPCSWFIATIAAATGNTIYAIPGESE